MDEGEKKERRKKRKDFLHFFCDVKV
jgi:hypothetical protein